MNSSTRRKFILNKCFAVIALSIPSLPYIPANAEKFEQALKIYTQRNDSEGIKRAQNILSQILNMGSHPTGV